MKILPTAIDTAMIRLLTSMLLTGAFDPFSEPAVSTCS
jgi:hypothetical protein